MLKSFSIPREIVDSGKNPKDILADMIIDEIVTPNKGKGLNIEIIAINFQEIPIDNAFHADVRYKLTENLEYKQDTKDIEERLQIGL